MNSPLEQLALWIQKKNQADSEIVRLTGRPAQMGYTGEYIASLIFDIQLDYAAHRTCDGRFRSGPLQGHGVNVKWYTKNEGALDIQASALPDDFLVLTGPVAAGTPTKESARIWVIDQIFLFSAQVLVNDLTQRKVKIGAATPLPKKWWEAAQLYPESRNPRLPISSRQREMIALFSSSALGPRPTGKSG